MRRQGYRYRRGESHPRARLTDDDVRLVRDLKAEGLGYKRIAGKFDTSPSTIRDICKHNTR